jgi:vacuolar-type H+-ATPase subunit E/Vma4
MMESTVYIRCRQTDLDLIKEV